MQTIQKMIVLLYKPFVIYKKNLITIAYNDIYTKKLQEKDKLEKRIKEEKDKLGIQ